MITIDRFKQKIFNINFFKKHQTLEQIIKFLLVGCLTGILDLIIYSLCYYIFFKHLRNVNFNFWIIRYSINQGGKCAFLSFALSFSISQIFNFFMQRKATFKANNNPITSGILYALMILGTYFFCLWFPTVISLFIYSKVGVNIGAIIVKLLCQTACTIIQFPLNKFIIMKQK